MARGAPLVRRLVVTAALLVAAACGRAPKLAELPAATLPADAEPAIEITGAAVDATSRLLTVTFQLTDRGTPVSLAAATTLKPTWFHAWLSLEPVSGLPAWRSLLLTGSATIGCLPPAGPGTPGKCSPLEGSFYANQKQPGTEAAATATTAGGTMARLDDGRFTYTFKDPLPTATPPDTTELLDETLRVAVYLSGATGAERTNTTFDFVPNNPTDASTPITLPRLKHYDTVTDAKCNACHGVLSAHGGRRIGVKLCVACHTWLLADPDTVDPAALNGTVPATKATFPNPLEMARMTHRIHRGKTLPTLYRASDWAAANRTWPPDFMSEAGGTWPAVKFTDVPPLPFAASRNAVADVGTRYSVIGHYSGEYVFGRVASRVDNFQPATTLAEGVGYPQDLRNCDACHFGAPQAGATVTSISRRTCSGCHPDVFYGDPNDAAITVPDSTHLAHTGGRQLDDTACADCHVLARIGGPQLYAPIAEIHKPLNDKQPTPNLHWSRVTAEIVGVQNMKPGQMPTITFKAFDRVGTLTPLNAPTPAYEPASATSSPVPRAMTGFSLILSGPTTDYLTGNLVMRASPPLTSTADGSGVFTYTFTTALPATAGGTWAVGIEGRRRPAAAPPAYATATDTFSWPYTGEAVSEHMVNDVKYVDLATGQLTTDATRARRNVVSQAKCEKCHLELNLHGANRHDVAHCNLCHTPDATDWDKRPRDTRTVALGGVVGTSMVLLNDPIDATATDKRWGYATVDGLEERSIHMKTMIHRIHVGEREGAASLEGIRPFAIYGNSSATGKPMVVFLDDIRYPNDLANCEVCHLDGTWTLEAIPAGAQPTTANELATILHAGTSTKPATAAHTSTSEPKVLPITAACISCHTNGAAVEHAAANTSGGVEQCGSCHGDGGAESIRRSHAIP